MAVEMEKALALAEEAGVDLGIEPEQANIVTSATDATRLIADMGSRHLKIVLDPANLFEHATPDEARAIVAAAIDEAAGHIATVSPDPAMMTAASSADKASSPASSSG